MYKASSGGKSCPGPFLPLVLGCVYSFEYSNGLGHHVTNCNVTSNLDGQRKMLVTVPLGVQG